MLLGQPLRAPRDAITGPVGPTARCAADMDPTDAATPSTRVGQPTTVLGVSTVRLTPPT